MGIYRTAVTRLSLLLGLTALALSQTQVNYPTQIKNGPVVVAGTKPLQTYLTALAGTGGTLVVTRANGIRNITSALTIASNVTLSCPDGATIENTTAHGGVIYLTAVSNVTIDGCTLIASGGNPIQAAGYTDGIGIYILGGSSHITISHVDISGHEVGGVCVNNGTYVTVENSYFHGGTNSSGFTNWTIPPHEVCAYGTADYLEVRYNTMLSLNDVGIGLEPFQTSSSTVNYANIHDNRVENKNAYAILEYAQVSNAGQTVDYGQIRNNIIRNITSRAGAGGILGQNNGGECIYNTTSNYTLIQGNTAQNCMIGRTGVTLPLGAISSGDSVGVKILDNLITDSAYDGIFISNVLFADAVGATVSHNTITSALHVGIITNMTVRPTISENSIKGPGDECVAVDAATTYASIAGNKCVSAGAQGIIGSGANATYTGNTVISATSAAFAVIGNDALLTANRSISAGTYGFQLVGTSGATLIGNEASGSGTADYLDNGSYAAGTLRLAFNTGPTTPTWSFNGSTYSSIQNRGLQDSVFSQGGNQQVIGITSASTGAPAFNCLYLGETFTRTDTPGLYTCTALPSTWTRVGP